MYLLLEKGMPAFANNNQPPDKKSETTFDFLNKEGFVNTAPAGSIEKLKAPKVILKPFEEEDLRKLFTKPDKSTFVKSPLPHSDRRLLFYLTFT